MWAKGDTGYDEQKPAIEMAGSSQVLYSERE
jgi:hypothetical protein